MYWTTQPPPSWMYFTKISQCVWLVRWKPTGTLVIMRAPSFDSISSELCEWKTLVMAENSQKPLPYFLKWRKQCKVKSDKESKTTQIAHEDLNDVDDPTKEVDVKAKWKFQPRWLIIKSNPWLDYDQENNSMKCSLCEYVWLTWEYPVTIFLCCESRTFEHIFFVLCL